MPKLPVEDPSVPIRVVLVEPYALVRAALHEMLDHDQDVEVVREEASILAAIETLRDDPVDVVLVHAESPSGGNVAILQRLKRESPGTALVLLGRRHDDGEVFRALQAGAAAHLPDAVRPTELVRTIRAVAGGEYLIDADVAARPFVARRVLDAFREATVASEVLDGQPPQRALVHLTPRETDILIAISEGRSNKEISASFTVSQHTVNNIVKGVLRKLAVNNRTRAVLLALRESWIPLHEGPRPGLN